MRRDEPADRMTVAEALEQFNRAIGRKEKWYHYSPALRWRLRPKQEPVARTIREDGRYLLSEAVNIVFFLPVGLPNLIGNGVRHLRRRWKKRKENKRSVSTV